MKTNEVILTIIIPTIGRKQELVNLLESIKATKKGFSFETLVIDQNDGMLIDDICNEYKSELNLIQHKVYFKGLSKAKNYGIMHAKGEILCFPDDDAEMTDSTIVTALEIMKEKNADCVFGKCIDKSTGKDSVINFQNNETELSESNFEGAFVEATMFAKAYIFDNVKYDENMGAGMIFGSQEGYDLVYRLLKTKVKLYYSPRIVFYHPQKIKTRGTHEEIKRAFYYSCGFGYLCKKHGFKDKYYKRLAKLMVGTPIIMIIKGRELDYYKAQIMGLKLGYKYLNDI